MTAHAPSCDREVVGRGFATVLLSATLGASLLAWSCGSLSEPPTTPEPTQSAAPPPPPADPNATPPPAPIFGAPAPKPTPTPEASPDPGATPAPDAPPEGGSGCGSPTPPDLSRIAVNVHLRGANWWVLDSTPLVQDTNYCAKIGFPDRSLCPVRPEGNPERSACELLVTGRAADTGRPGPTWTLDGRFCTGSASGCQNHPENQYLVLAYAAGTYRACGKNGVCGEVEVDR
ncbi:MAG TPA: hypothetical protein VGB87_00520 [Vicinamibacteria bacterium]